MREWGAQITADFFADRAEKDLRKSALFIGNLKLNASILS
jgi:hypothetical protein